MGSIEIIQNNTTLMKDLNSHVYGLMISHPKYSRRGVETLEKPLEMLFRNSMGEGSVSWEGKRANIVHIIKKVIWIIH